MKILGIDPGLGGALALIGDGFLAVEDMPVMGVGRQKVVNGAQVANIVDRWEPDTVMLERVHAMPKQGVVSAFRFGQVLGTIEGIVLGINIPLRYCTPQKWKKHFRLNADKEQARMQAIRLFPSLADQLSRKKDDGRAEALLIAKYFDETRGTT
jgi:crossover junction endodeoxyribonuclease RuvC